MTIEQAIERAIEDAETIEEDTSEILAALTSSQTLTNLLSEAENK